MPRLVIAAMAGSAGTCSLIYLSEGVESGAIWAFATAMSLLLALKCLSE